MNWKLILALSLFGLVIAVASLFGLGFMGPTLWLFIVGLCACFIAALAPGKYFLHGFLVNILSMFWIFAIHACYLLEVSQNKPVMVEILPGGRSPQVENLLLGLAAAGVTGVIGGLFAFVASLILKKRAPSESEAAR